MRGFEVPHCLGEGRHQKLQFPLGCRATTIDTEIPLDPDGEEVVLLRSYYL